MARAALLALAPILLSSPARGGGVEWMVTAVFPLPLHQVRAAAIDALEHLGYVVARSLDGEGVTAHDLTIVRQPDDEAAPRARLLEVARVDDAAETDLPVGSELDLRLQVELEELGERGVRVLIGGRITLLRPSSLRGFADVVRLQSRGVAEREVLDDIERRLARSTPATWTAEH